MLPINFKIIALIFFTRIAITVKKFLAQKLNFTGTR